MKTLDGIIHTGVNVRATDNPEIARRADIVIFCCPVSAYIPLLKKISRYVSPNVSLGTIFGQARFDKMVDYIFSENQPCFATPLIPWVCRATEYGTLVNNLGELMTPVAIRGNTNVVNLVLNNIYTEKPYLVDQMKRITFERQCLRPSNIIVHTALCYGRYVEGSTDPYFYKNVSSLQGECLDKLDAERIQVVKAIIKYDKVDVDTSTFIQTHETRGAFGENAAEVLRANECLQYIQVPDPIPYDHRFYTDDIPYGLCYMKYMAEKTGVNTPFTDSIIMWAQENMGKEYIKNGLLVLENIPSYFILL
jgi:hypothetical protein